MTRGTPESSQIIFLENRVKELEEELDAYKMDGCDASHRIKGFEQDLKEYKNLTEELQIQIASDRETLKELYEYRKLVHYIANDYHELSYDKAYNQRDWWKKQCKKLMEDIG